MKITHAGLPILGGLLTTVLMFQACEKQGDSGTDPTVNKPDQVVVTANKDTVLTYGRDSSLWSFQLYRNGLPFARECAITALTRLGYFVQGNTQLKRITLMSDGSGHASTYFYGDDVGGFALTQIWGDGFGVDTVHTVIVVGAANSLALYIRDPASSTWGTTDTLRSGTFRGKADSTFVKVIVRDRGGNPLPGIRIDLEVFVNGARVPLSKNGYFKSTINPDSVSTGFVYSDAQGEGTDVFYSDDFPNLVPTSVELAAHVEDGTFGRISVSRFIIIRK